MDNLLSQYQISRYLDIVTGANNRIATISGTVNFDFKNGVAKVQSAGTPKVTKYITEEYS